MLRIFGIVVVLALALLFIVLSWRSEKSNLFKWTLTIIFVAFAFTWILPNGSFVSGTFKENENLIRLGLSDIPSLIHYAFYFILTTVIFLLALGGFYGVLSKSKSYQSLVRKFGKWIKNHDILATIIIICVVSILTTLLRIPFAVLMIIPFITSSLLHAKFDKVTTMGMTYGSMAVGIMGATLGTDSLYWFNYYLNGRVITDGIWYRFVIFIAGLILFTLYNIYRVIKKVRTNKNSEASEDPYVIEEKDDAKKKASIWPAIIVLVLTLIFIILGYFGWAEEPFKIEAFNKFHEWISEFSFFKVDGDKFPLVHYILGGQTNTPHVAFGTYQITSLITFIVLISAFVGFMSKIKWSDYLKAFGEGVTKMFKPTMAYVVAYIIFVVVYLSPFTITIVGNMFNWTSSMNPFVVLLSSFVTSIFHADLGYTSYTLSAVLSTYTAGELTIAQTIFVAVNGLVQLVLPVAGFTVIGLASLDVDYRKWLKYIWMFALAMLVVIVLVSVIGFYVII